MERTDRFLFFVTLSVLINFLLLIAMQKLDRYLSLQNAPPPEKKMLVRLNDETKRQVVKTEQEKKKPEKAEFFAEQDTATETEMRAENSGKFRNTPGTSPQDAGQPQANQKPEGEIGRDRAMPSVKKLLNPFAGTPRAQTYDALDRNKGPKTLLNANEYIYASFFNRIKEKVGPLWEQRVWRVVRHEGHLLKNTRYLTVLHITLNREGEVLDIDVTKRASFREFDHIAKQAFWEARRFPNPPSGLFKGQRVAGFDFSFLIEPQSAGIVNFRTIPDQRYMPRR